MYDNVLESGWTNELMQAFVLFQTGGMCTKVADWAFYVRHI